MTKYFEGEPDFVNQQGVKWWFNEDFTEQARPQLDGTCWEVELEDGQRELVFLAEDGAVLKSTTQPTTMHDWIKMQKLTSRDINSFE